MGEGFASTLRNVKPYLAMVSLQFGYAGMYIITMVSLKHGMSHFVLAVYRHAVATLVIAPFALVLERSPPLLLHMLLDSISSRARSINYFTHEFAFANLLIAIHVNEFCRKIRPKMTLPIFLRIMVLGFLECVSLYYACLCLHTYIYTLYIKALIILIN